MRVSAASTPSVVVGLVTKENAPRARRVLAILVERDDLHGDVPRQRILLELAEHGPAEHVGQEYVERHRRRLELLGEIERVGAARGDQHLEALVAGEVQDDAGVMRVVLDDQQDAVAGLDLQPIVRDVLHGAIGRRQPRARGPCMVSGPRHGARAAGRVGRTDVFHRQIEREGAALARRAVQLDFAAEQVREFAADREAEAGAAVLAAGAGVGLLERLEDDLLLFQRNADAGVGHLEGDDAQAPG